MKLIIALAFVSLSLTACQNFGEKINFKGSDLYYTRNVTKDDATKLGNYLVDQQFYTDQKKVSVQLDKRGDTFLFRMVTVDSYLNNQDYLQTIRTFEGQLSQSVFNGQPVVVELCDDQLKTEKVVQP